MQQQWMSRGEERLYLFLSRQEELWRDYGVALRSCQEMTLPIPGEEPWLMVVVMPADQIEATVLRGERGTYRLASTENQERGCMYRINERGAPFTRLLLYDPSVD